jgi:hypothetical protein
MQKEIVIDEQLYVLGKIKTGVGRKLRETLADPKDFNVAFLAESLKAGGNPDATIEWVDANIDFFNTFNTLVTAAYEVNGFKVAQPKAGEDQPAEPAESTSITSTAA